MKAWGAESHQQPHSRCLYLELLTHVDRLSQSSSSTSLKVLVRPGQRDSGLGQTGCHAVEPTMDVHMHVLIVIFMQQGHTQNRILAASLQPVLQVVKARVLDAKQTALEKKVTSSTNACIRHACTPVQTYKLG